MRLAAYTLFLALSLVSPAFGQGLESEDHVTARLISEHAALVPGETGYVAVSYAIEASWHLYWLNPGDSGLPIEVVLGDLPPGITAGAPQWPAPKRYPHGGLVDFIYEGRVTALIPITVAATVKPGSVLRLRVRSSWLVCQEACLPESAEMHLEIPVKASAGAASADQALFRETRARLPTDPGESVKVRWDGLRLVLSAQAAQSLQFFPLTPEDNGPADLHEVVAKGSQLAVAYPKGVRGQGEVKGLLEVRYADRTRFHWITTQAPPAPGAKE